HYSRRPVEISSRLFESILPLRLQFSHRFRFTHRISLTAGVHASNNFTLGKALTLYDTGIAYLCNNVTSQYPVAYYLFSPSSNSAQPFDSRGDPLGNQSMSIDLLRSGYWTGGYGPAPPGPAQFHPFKGEYTVVAADEWGGVAL